MSSNSTTPEVSDYQRMIMTKYPFERLLPKNSTDPDVLMNHIMTTSFSSDRSTIKQQAVMQAAEEYALQQCTLQCKRDGRLKKEKPADPKKPGDEKTITLDDKQIMAKIQAEIDAGKMSAAEIKKFNQTKAFRAALDAIPWVEEPAEVPLETTKKVEVKSNEPKPFVGVSLGTTMLIPEPTEAEKAEKRYEESRKQKSGTEDDDNDTQVVEVGNNVKVVEVGDDGEETPGELVSAPHPFDIDGPTLSAADLHPAIPEGAVAPAITEEQLAIDPNNPTIVPQPIKERENRFSFASNFDEFAELGEEVTEEQIKQMLRDKKAAHEKNWEGVDKNIAGFVADGSAIPIRNEGALARGNLPPVYRDGPAHREKVMSEVYDPSQDKPFLWNKHVKKFVVSMIGPDCPQKCPRRMFRIWGGVKDDDEAKQLMKEACKKNKYAHKWRTYLYSIQRWVEFPPKGNQDKVKGTVMENNNEFEEYLQANFDHQKHVVVELEQRAMDTKAMEKTEGQSIIQQLKEKNMDIGLADPSTLPR